MTKDQFDEFFTEIINDIKQTRDEGQKEYAHDVINVFANFERTAKQLGTTRDKVLMTFLIKHMDGIIAHVNGHTSQREDVRGRIKDAIVYLTLLWAMAEAEANVEWGTEEFLADSGFVNSNKFNQDTGEVTYQSLGDETV
jgi:hypothetical protein